MTKRMAAFVVFQKRTVFIPLKYIYPECSVLIDPYQQLFPLFCLREDGCPANSNCMETLAKRVDYFFTNVVPDAELLIAYFKYRDRSNSIRAGVFDREMQNPRVMTLNPYAFRKFQKEGTTYKWVPPDEFLFMGGSSELIPVKKLLEKPVV